VLREATGCASGLDRTVVLERCKAATKMASPCSLCVNTENTEGLSGLCV